MRFLDIYSSHQYPFGNNGNKERLVGEREEWPVRGGNCHIILIKDPLLRAGHRKPHTAESQSNWKHPSGTHAGCTFDQVPWWCSGNNNTALKCPLRITTRWVGEKPTLWPPLCISRKVSSFPHVLWCCVY